MLVTGLPLNMHCLCCFRTEGLRGRCCGTCVVQAGSHTGVPLLVSHARSVGQRRVAGRRSWSLLHFPLVAGVLCLKLERRDGHACLMTLARALKQEPADGCLGECRRCQTSGC